MYQCISQSQRQVNVTYTDNLSTTYLACHRLRTIDPLVNKKSYVYFAFLFQSVFSCYSLNLILWLVSFCFHKGTRNNYVCNPYDIRIFALLNVLFINVTVIMLRRTHLKTFMWMMDQPHILKPLLSSYNDDLIITFIIVIIKWELYLFI